MTSTAPRLHGEKHSQWGVEEGGVMKSHGALQNPVVSGLGLVLEPFIKSLS